jgi:outer membrane protein assembly factor BamB
LLATEPVAPRRPASAGLVVTSRASMPVRRRFRLPTLRAPEVAANLTRMAKDPVTHDAHIADLIYVGLNSRAAALYRTSGKVAWQWKAGKGRGFVAILLDGEHLIASVQGYTYCLDARTGRELWSNQLHGFGLGVPCLASLRGTSLGASLLAQAQADASAQAD